jgi:hypothetical protein
MVKDARPAGSGEAVAARRVWPWREGLTVVTVDRKFLPYDAAILGPDVAGRMLTGSLEIASTPPPESGMLKRRDVYERTCTRERRQSSVRDSSG